MNYSVGGITKKDIWMHVVIVVSGANRKLYIDGILVDEITDAVTTGFEITTGHYLFVGESRIGTMCQLDDFRIFNRVSAQNEITALANE
jgi:hypothetical protein